MHTALSLYSNYRIGRGLWKAWIKTLGYKVKQILVSEQQQRYDWLEKWCGPSRQIGPPQAYWAAISWNWHLFYAWTKILLHLEPCSFTWAHRKLCLRKIGRLPAFKERSVSAGLSRQASQWLIHKHNMPKQFSPQNLSPAREREKPPPPTSTSLIQTSK